MKQLAFPIIATILSIVLIGFGLSQLLYSPLPWSDEAIYHQMVLTHHQTGEFGVPMWKGLLAETEVHNYWYPPFFFSSLSWYARFVPLTLENQRLFSLALSTIALTSFAYLAKIYTNSKYYFIPLFVLATDFLWLRASRMSRPEILILALGSLSLVFIHRFATSKNSRDYALAVILAACALLSHYYGLWVTIANVLFLWFYPKSNLKKQAVIFPLLSTFPLVVWMLQLYKHWPVLIDHTLLGVQNKISIEPITWLGFKTNTFPLKLQFSLVQLASFISMAIAWKNKEIRWLSLLVGIIWLMIIVGKMFWYVVYILPFTYLLWFRLSKTLRYPLYRKVWIGMGIMVLILNLNTWYSDQQALTRSSYSYEEYGKVVATSIPERSTAFLTAEPETYYAFLKYNPSVHLIMYPAVATSDENYRQVLNSADYVVFTGDYVGRLFGKFLPNYLEKNVESYQTILGDQGTPTTVIKLKPKDQRS